MTVYVDDMYKTDMGRYRRMKMSHMLADTEEELHMIANKIGIARKWFQGDHYDIALSKQALAIENGAIEVTLKQMAKMNYIRRKTGSLGNPETCDIVFVELWRAPDV